MHDTRTAARRPQIPRPSLAERRTAATQEMQGDPDGLERRAAAPALLTMIVIAVVGAGLVGAATLAAAGLIDAWISALLNHPF